MAGLAVVTGGARGIGQGIVKALQKQDTVNRVVVLDHKPEQSFDVDVYECDVCDEDAVRQAAEAIGEVPTVLVNNAGGSPSMARRPRSAPSDPFGEVEAWRATVDLNLTAAHIVTRVFGPTLQPGAAICNVASIAGVLPGSLFAYSAAKAGLIHWTRCLALALAPQRIRVNAVAPGFVYTDQLRRFIPERAAFEALTAETIPLGVEQTPEDIAASVAFLCSDQAVAITGQILAIDGGTSLGKPPSL